MDNKDLDTGVRKEIVIDFAESDDGEEQKLRGNSAPVEFPSGTFSFPHSPPSFLPHTRGIAQS